MKIALLGYGKMGRMIEKLAHQRGHQVVFISDPSCNTESSSTSLENADVAIEFTVPESAVNNLISCFQSGVPVVCGTTGWLAHWDKVAAKVKEYDGGLFYASNYSLGVNLFFKLNRELAKLMNGYPDYQVNMIETHHTQKLDAPSGTALTLAHDIIDHHQGYEQWVLNTLAPKSLPVFALREGQVSGTHEINYVSLADKISIRHEAFSREGFAAGAIAAAEFMVAKKGIFSMEDMLG